MKKMIFTIAACLLMTGLAQAELVLIDDDFSGSSTSSNSRFRESQADLGWYVSNATNDWVLSTGTAGEMSNAGTTGGAASEGAIAQLVSTSGVAAANRFINISFDYDVGADANLFMHLTGWSNNVTTASPTHTFLNNPGAQNGSLQNQGDTSNYADINILNGSDPNGGSGNAINLTGTGTYTGSFDLLTYTWSADEAFVPGQAGPGFSGNLTGVNQLDYIQIAFATNISNNLGDSAISIDNLILTASVPEPSTFAMFLGGLSLLTMRRRRA